VPKKTLFKTVHSLTSGKVVALSASDVLTCNLTTGGKVDNTPARFEKRGFLKRSLRLHLKGGCISALNSSPGWKSGAFLNTVIKIKNKLPMLSRPNKYIAHP
jgi:hypothetical protein